MNTKKRIAKFLTTLTCLGMASVNAYGVGADSSCGPCFDPCCPSPDRCFFADIDYIYWTAREEGLDLAYTGALKFTNPDTSTESVSCPSGHCHDCNYDWNSGFKIGAGLSNPCCDWQIYAQYTWYQSKPSRHVKSYSNSQLINSWLTPAIVPMDEQVEIFENQTTFLLNGAVAKWNLKYNNIDVLVSNEFCVNNCFTLRPSFGIKGAWFHQKFGIDYDVDSSSFSGPQTLTFNSYNIYIRNKQNFWGVGPKFALTAAATVFDCISIYGNVGVSALWSEFCSNRSDKDYSVYQDPDSSTSTDVAEEIRSVCMKRHFCQVEPVLESSIGARWDTDLCCGDYGFYVKIAWENQIWFHHNHMLRVSGLTYLPGNLTLQGLTIGAGLSF